jgi:L-seryl-tRNA(Ser) seleniumtransferase
MAQNAVAQTPNAPFDCDRFGNRLDPNLRYARGQILADDLAEMKRQQYAYTLVRERYSRDGDAGLFNLTGLIRAFHFEPGDSAAMQSYVHFLARSQRELEKAAIPLLGGSPDAHDGFLCTRVTAGMLAIMLTILKPGDKVLSLVPADRSHPSILSAVKIGQAHFTEVTSLDEFTSLVSTESPHVAVISAISPSKHHLPLASTQAAIAAARKAGCLIVLDDAHMAARLAIYDEPPALALGPDLCVWSLDKHLGGPRSGFVSGSSELVSKVRVKALMLGVEAQLGQYIAGLNAVRAWNPGPVRQAAELARQALAELSPTLPQVYSAGAGIALTGEDLLQLALAKAGLNTTEVAPIEAVAYAAITLLEKTGAVTIPAVGMPGAACTLRLMLYPDGIRYGLTAVVRAMHDSVEVVAEALKHPQILRQKLLGGQ